MLRELLLGEKKDQEKNDRYLSRKELIQVYGITHPDEPLATHADQDRAYRKMIYGNKYDPKKKMDKMEWAVLGIIGGILLMILILCPQLLILFLL